MRKFFILENDNKEGVDILGERIENYLSERGCSYTKLKGYMDRDRIPADTECIITIGGDGTLISAASQICELEIPIIGVNAGHLGYLTSASKKEELPSMLTQLIEGDFHIIDCNTLTANVDGSEIKCAINEVTVGKRSPLHLAHVKVSVDGEFLNDYAADGIIVSTPTGSTAYNLSAGGPIIQTGLDAFAITPVCAHINISQSLIVSSDSEIELEITEAGESEPVATFDGRKEMALQTGSRIIIRKGSHPIHFIRLGNETFISNLRKKMQALK